MLHPSLITMATITKLTKFGGLQHCIISLYLASQKYYILVNVINKHESEITLLSTLKGAYSSLKVRGKESFGLTIETLDNRRVTFKAIEADGSSAFINGEKEIHLIPRIAATSFTLNITKHPAGMYGFGFEVVLCM